MAKMVEITCVDCGKVFKKNKMAHTKVRCPECQYKRSRQLGDESRRRRTGSVKREEKPVASKHECKLVSTCIYRGSMGGTLICDYREIMGHRRPCEVQGCTEYKEGEPLNAGRREGIVII